ncbi:hypothetical protein C8R41DRAFT_522339 [Lentinula lateritia]|uniref:Uncharacterized protein n=1 Tax=Lentinula lateritia TaxID=40482 RepID=A0ABQ8V701_9AGAR|nr:hypothetical protein C8R41DRAFT_522339 [Lentinula lateritia]
MTGLAKSAIPFAMREKGKRFLDLNDTLKLATSIAETRERKVQSTIGGRSQHTEAEIQAPLKTRKARNSAKLAGIKMQIASDRARLKKNKAKMRKQVLLGLTIVPEKRDSLPPKKRVSFA